MTEKEIKDLTAIDDIWRVREDNKVYNALKIGIPIVLSSQNSFAAKDITNIARQIIRI